MKSLYAIRAVLAWAVLLGGASASGAQTTPTIVRVGTIAGLSDAGLLIAENLGYFKEAGIAVELKRMDSSPSIVTALATNDIQVGGIAITPSIYTAVDQGINIRIVGDKNSHGPGFDATQLVARRAVVTGDGNKVQKLRGKSIGLAARASATFYQLSEVLKHNQMTLKDVRVVDMSYANMVTALMSGALDGALLTEPYTTQALENPDIVNVSNLVHKKLVSTVALVYSEQFAANKDAGLRFMIAYMRGVRKYIDAVIKGIDKNAMLDIVAEKMRLDSAFVRKSFPPGLDPNQRVDIDFLRTMQDFYIEHGYLQKRIDVNRVVDTSFADGAIKQLGEYSLAKKP
jgi:NitT/TauT family transport system substrate-binding protein